MRLADFLDLCIGVIGYISQVLLQENKWGRAKDAPLGPRRDARLGYSRASLGGLLTLRQSELLSPSPWRSMRVGAGQTHRWAKWVERVSQVRKTKKRGRSGKEVREKTHRFGLKSLDGLHVRADVVRDGLKFAQGLLRFIHDAFVL